MSEKKDFSIEEIITGEKIITLFQPIVSIKKKQITGVEALNRGINPETGEVINPVSLIEEAIRFGFMLELDRLFRKKSLEAFSVYNKINRDHILFLNLDSSAILQGFGSGHLLKTAGEYSIDPSSVVLEILESEVSDLELLSEFVMNYRSEGFMIGLDDFGAGFSNWDRIISLKPDIIKLDRSIIKDIDTDFFKQEVAGSLIRLAHNTGSLVVAEGVESQEEGIKSMELGADFIQGFFFSIPVNPETITGEYISDTISRTSNKYISMRKAGWKEVISARKQYQALSDEIIAILVTKDFIELNDILNTIPAKFPELECIYILNSDGLQISETVLNPLYSGKKLPKIFHPDELFTDQSSKEYYFNIFNGNDMYVSRPYISSATGNTCITVSRSYTDLKGKRRILCLDLL